MLRLSHLIFVYDVQKTLGAYDSVTVDIAEGFMRLTAFEFVMRVA